MNNQKHMETVEGLAFRQEGYTAIVVINRPEAMNALTPTMRNGLAKFFANAAIDESVRAIVVTGAGNKAFCAGADLTSTIPDMTSGKTPAVADPTRRWLSDVHKPVIAAVNGVCLAAGTEMLLGTDLRIAVDTASFGLPEVKWGLVPAGGSHVRLPRQVPWAVAMEMLLLGGRIEAKRAYEIGLINRIVTADALMSEALKMADLAASNGPLAVRAAKEIAVRAMGLESPFSLEAAMSKNVFSSEDAVEGPKAFREKRKPNFRGR